VRPRSPRTCGHGGCDDYVPGKDPDRRSAGPLALATGCSSTPARSTTPAATRQVHVAPVEPDGSPARGYRTTSTASNASCSPGSEAIGQAYRCFTGNFVYDPCWAEKAATPTVLCLAYPWSVANARLSVSAPLSPIPNQGAAGLPWGVELAGGQRCVLLQGAHSVFNGRVIDYYCGPGLSLLRGLDESGRAWRADSVTQKSGKLATGPTEEIRIAWFGRADTYR
jgi:hypothetical protein